MTNEVSGQNDYSKTLSELTETNVTTHITEISTKSLSYTPPIDLVQVQINKIMKNQAKLKKDLHSIDMPGSCTIKNTNSKVFDESSENEEEEELL